MFYLYSILFTTYVYLYYLMYLGNKINITMYLHHLCKYVIGMPSYEWAGTYLLIPSKLQKREPSVRESYSHFASVITLYFYRNWYIGNFF